MTTSYSSRSPRQQPVRTRRRLPTIVEGFALQPELQETLLPPVGVALRAVPEHDVFGRSLHDSRRRPGTMTPQGYDLAEDPTGLLSIGPTDDMVETIEHVLSLRELGSVSAKDCRTAYGPTDDNELQLFVDGEETFKRAIFPKIAAARESVNIMIYQLRSDIVGEQLVNLLAQKAKEGVWVHLVCDGEGSQQLPWTASRRMISRLKETAADPALEGRLQVVSTPVLFSGTVHQKCVVIDGEEALLGATNFKQWSLHSPNYQRALDEVLRTGDASSLFEAEPDAHGNHAPRVVPHDTSSTRPEDRAIHDDMLWMRGPAVQQVQAEFAMTFMQRGGTLYPGLSWDDARATMFRPYSERHPDKSIRDLEQPNKVFKGATVRLNQGIPEQPQGWMKAAIRMIQNAESSVRIEAAYVTAPEVLDTLVAAAQRGVQVEMITPKASDHPIITGLPIQKAYTRLAPLGAVLRQYHGFNHGKILLVDDRYAHIGSADYMGFTHASESVASIDHPAFVSHVRERIFKVDTKDSQSLGCGAEDWHQLPVHKKALGHFWHKAWKVLAQPSLDDDSTTWKRLGKELALTAKNLPKNTWKGLKAAGRCMGAAAATLGRGAARVAAAASRRIRHLWRRSAHE